jgi:hypothetical protein
VKTHRWLPALGDGSTGNDWLGGGSPERSEYDSVGGRKPPPLGSAAAAAVVSARVGIGLACLMYAEDALCELKQTARYECAAFSPLQRWREEGAAARHEPVEQPGISRGGVQGRLGEQGAADAGRVARHCLSCAAISGGHP